MCKQTEGLALGRLTFDINLVDNHTNTIISLLLLHLHRIYSLNQHFLINLAALKDRVRSVLPHQTSFIPLKQFLHVVFYFDFVGQAEGEEFGDVDDLAHGAVGSCGVEFDNDRETDAREDVVLNNSLFFNKRFSRRFEYHNEGFQNSTTREK